MMSLFDILFGNNSKSENEKPEKKSENDNPDFEMDGLRLIRYLGKTETVVIPYNVRFVGEGAFAGCETVKTIIFNDMIYNIEKSAFIHCRNLKSVIFSQIVERIEESVFFGCVSLENLVIPNKVSKLDFQMFKNCHSLKKLTLPDTLSEIYFFTSLNQNVIICARRGTFAEKFARKYGYQFEPLDSYVKEGFYPICSEGNPVAFYNPQKGVCKQVVDGKGHIINFPGYEHPDFILSHYDGDELPCKRGYHIGFSKRENGYILVMNIQHDSWYYYGESGFAELYVYAEMNDEGEFTSKFRLYKIGGIKYENTDLEEKEYNEFLRKKQKIE